MSDVKEKTKTVTVYTFGLCMKHPLSEKNAHDQLYDEFKHLKDDWYQAQGDESRRIQFIQKDNALLCQSSVEPKGLAFNKKEIKVTIGDRVKIRVRLPALRRLKKDNVTRMIPIKSEDKDDYYSSILERKGVEVYAIDWEEKRENTIFFTNNKRKVAIPVDDVDAIVLVTDLDAFINSIQQGVGRYKTYGCGMIEVVKNQG